MDVDFKLPRRVFIFMLIFRLQNHGTFIAIESRRMTSELLSLSHDMYNPIYIEKI